jgi:hypothetical protein
MVNSAYERTLSLLAEKRDCIEKVGEMWLLF